MFPLRARKGGVLVRTGQTEGSVDLARLAGLKPAGVICEIMREDGEMARRPELEEFAQKHGLLLLSVADMIAYRLQRERIVRCQGDRRDAARARSARASRSPRTTTTTDVEDTEYLALVRGDVAACPRRAAPCSCASRRWIRSPIRSHLRPDLVAALKAIDDAGVGVFLYVVQPRRARSSARRSSGSCCSATPARDRASRHRTRPARRCATSGSARRCSPTSGCQQDPA